MTHKNKTILGKPQLSCDESFFGQDAEINKISIRWELEFNFKKSGVEVIPLLIDVMIWGERNNEAEDEIHQIWKFDKVRFCKDTDDEYSFDVHSVDIDFESSTILIDL